MQKNEWVFAILSFQVMLSAAPIQSGKAYFQTENIDVTTGKTDDTYYPTLAAPDKVSVTTTTQNPDAPIAPYRLHSWLGGAILWATGQEETNSKNGYFVARNVPASNTWPAELFQQAPLIANPIILEYLEPPNSAGSDPLTRGVNLCLPYPYYNLDAAYGDECITANSFWNKPPLLLETDSQKNLLVFPTNTAPPTNTATGSIWAPNSLLVDRMGDWDVDLIFQNPSDPYIKTDLSDPVGKGQYIKYTVAQGCPFVYVECRGAQFIGFSNRMIGNGDAGLIVDATAEAVVPTFSKVSYFLIGGNQNNPAVFAEDTTLNPPGEQDNFTTWAVYFNNDPALGINYVAGTGTTQPQNSHLEFPDTNKKYYFVIAAIPTIYAYPTDNKSYSDVIALPNNDVVSYAEELGKYAFNFITDTKINYSVTNSTFLKTTFSPTLATPYTDVSDTTNTVMCLMPHHYQKQKFAAGVEPDVLDPTGWADFSPTGATDLFYWSVRGNLKAIVGTDFTTKYIFTNFLPAMPPPFWTHPVNTDAGLFTIGQLLFDSIDNEYINNLADPAFAPWNTAYFTSDKGIYDVGKTLSKASKELSLVAQFLQGMEENQQSGETFNTFFFKTLKEQQYNNRPDLPDRPGAFNAPQNKPRLQALQDAVKSSTIGAAIPTLAGVQGAFSHYFLKTPVTTKGKAPSAFYNLGHYAYYDPIGHIVMLYPSAGTPQAPTKNPVPWPSRMQTLPIHTIFGEVGNKEVSLGSSIGIVWESFGVANAFNDHHYQLGYWISTAALATMYDGTWNTPPNNGTKWGDQSSFGQAVDQLVADIAFNKENNGTELSFYKNPKMSFAKLNFFDQWEGHGWADGIEATIAGGSSGHNENSIGEALQGYASIILWGMASGRKDITDLGIYLYTTTCYSMDSYFFDKNLNLKKGQTPTVSFVPTTTKTGGAYPSGTAFIDATIHSGGAVPTSSGTPKISQAVINYSADFGQTPENIKVINAFPCAPWTLVYGRNKEYLEAWNASMDTDEFVATISPNLTVDTNCWKRNFDANMNMLRMLGGNTVAFGQNNYTTGPTPYDFMIDLFTQFGTTPPWGALGGSFVDPSQSINEVIHFLHIIDYYGTPDWTVYGHGTSDELVFTAAFTKDGTTTYFAFNPTLNDVEIQFKEILTDDLKETFMVKPKRWATFPAP